jgi:hypothetical protein
MTVGGRLDDPNFTVDTHDGYCVVNIKDTMSVVIINNDHFVEVEAYENTEDDAPMDSMVFTKEIQSE